MSRDSVGHTLIVATVLCVVCSLLVSAAAAVSTLVYLYTHNNQVSTFQSTFDR